jgi:uncharacterized protein (DUF4213/DUF364 family)
MNIVEDFLEMFRKINEKIDLPVIKEILIPPLLKVDKNARKSNFCVIGLNDDSIGLVYINLSDEIKEDFIKMDLSRFNGFNAYDLVKEYQSSDIILKTLGFGAINAISQYIFKRSSFDFDYTSDPLGLLNIKKNDTVGMVGFFHPLIKTIKKLKNPLTIIEKKENLVRKTEDWEISLEPSKLEKCNKILITSTTLLNDTIDDILRYCRKADKISIVGPTAGFLPDPLFTPDINIDIVGGTFVSNPNLFLDFYKKAEHWSPAVKKYCIKNDSGYPGYEKLLEMIK